MLDGFGVRTASFLLLFALLSACDSAEERAQKHFESGLALIEAGDTERGLVELRNVLSLDEFHIEGRKLYATTLREQGNIAESYAQFRRLVESNPSDHVSRLALAQMAIKVQNWPEVERHGGALIQANVELEGTEVVDLMIRFREAALEEDEAALQALKEEAASLVSVFPDDVTLRQILVEAHLRAGDYEEALVHLNHAIALEPDNRRFYMAKARVLGQLEELNDLEDFLREMVRMFPDDTETKLSLVRLYSAQGRTERAEEFLREFAEESGEERDVITLITYIRQVGGNEAALTEIEQRLTVAPDATFLLALKAAVLFEIGQRDEAIALMESVVDVDNPTDQINRYKVSLAKMLQTEGNLVGARTKVEEVLASDSSQVEALKMSAEWLISDDKPEDAIGQLRIALDQEPDDSEAMMLMSDAHLRMGDRELAQDLLSLAVDASDNAPRESIRFAEFLLAEESVRPAENVLLNALRNDPDNFRILNMLGQVYIQTEDWGRADQIAATFRRMDSERAQAAAANLEYQAIGRRQGRDQAIAFLENMAESDDNANVARVGLIRSRLRSGDAEGAVALAQELSAEAPDNARIKMILGNTQIAAGRYAEAEAVFEEIVRDFPRAQDAWIQLSRTQSSQGRGEDAQATIDRALAGSPDAPNLLWAKASYLERDNDIDGAIEIYEQLYASNSNSNVVANNLASLLATYRTDDESLERAYTVGRRLRGTDVPPFQDTYGWILHRRGDFEEAVTYLEPAAAALQSDPIVQYHLAMTYLRLGRNADAKALFEQVLIIAGEDDVRPQIESARTELESLSTPTTEN